MSKNIGLAGAGHVGDLIAPSKLSQAHRSGGRDRVRLPLHEAGKRSEEYLLKWEQLFEHVAWGVVVFGSPGLLIRAVNPAYAQMHGYTVGELAGRPLDYTIAPEARPNLERSLKTADERGHYIYDSVHVRKDGTTFPVLIDFTALKDDFGNVLLRWGNAQDATERKRLEERLLEKQKVESLGVLAGGLAHDFNNLLTIIIGNANMALETQPADPARANLAEVIRASEKAADLTRQILAYSGKGGFVIQPLNLSDEVRATTNLLQKSIPKNVRLELDLADDILPVVADRCQIQQLIINLVVNGSEAIGEQYGTVWVKARMEAIDEQVIGGDFCVGDLRPGIYACLAVRDTGCGMDQKMVTRIFDPFFTTKFMGRGLGLAAVLGIVLSLHGAAVVRSKLGEGSTFRVFLPVAEAQPGGKQAVPQL